MTTDRRSAPQPIHASNGAASQAVSTPDVNWRPVLTTAFGILAGLAVLVVFLELFVAHRLPPMTEDSLDAAQKRWAAAKPASYNLDLEIRGGDPGTAHVEVRDGEVVACQRNGVTPDERRVWDVWTVPGQFETLQRELQLAADPVHQMDATPGTQLTLQCEFDPHYGYPQQYHRIVVGSAPEVFCA